MNERQRGREVMNSPKGGEVSIDRLKTRLDVLHRRAKLLGVMTYCTISYEDMRHSLRGSEELFGASLGKLPLASMVIDRLDPEQTLATPSDMIDTSGGGYYDQPSNLEEHVPVSHLLEDMLRYSGNTAYRVLAQELGGSGAINAYYKEQGWHATDVQKGLNGRAQLGYTSPDESLTQLYRLVDNTDERLLAEVAKRSLRENAVTTHGIRQTVKNSRYLTVYNKTGEYNGDRDDPHVFRHDVGLVTGPKGRVGYAVMTSAPMITRGIISDMVVAQLGAEITYAVGGTNTIALGSRALRAAK